MNELQPIALIADDEHLLIQALENELAVAWPELHIADRVGDGSSAITKLLTGIYDIAFLDIQMPMENGIEVMQAVTEEWSDAHNAKPPPSFVFVTAHDEFAIDAFELAAVDYVVKPVSAARIQKTVERLKQNWQARTNAPALNTLVEQVSKISTEERRSNDRANWLDAVRAGIGSTVHLIPMDDIVMFEASDKYIVVHSNQQQALIRESLRNLLPKLNPDQFRQIHRSTIVNLDYVKAASRIGGSKMTLTLKGCDQTPVVSRVYRHLFKAM